MKHPDANRYAGLLRAKKSGNRITEFQVFGERRSGTNYIEHLIAGNFTIVPVTNYGWKHGSVLAPGIAHSSLLVVVVRHPFEWLLGIHQSPHESWMWDLAFPDFIRRPWTGIYVQVSLLQSDWGIGGFRPTDKVQLQYDRHPIEGRPFRDVFELRDIKNQVFLGFFERHTAVALVQYEAALRNPESVVEEMGETFGLTRNSSEMVPVERRVGPQSPKPRLSWDEVSDEDKAYVVEKVDWDFEGRLGYARS